jgi:hypothetical protein
MFMGVVDGACALAAGSAAVPMALPAAVTAVAAALSTVAAALSSAAAALLEEAAATAVLFEAVVASGGSRILLQGMPSKKFHILFDKNYLTIW